MNKPLICLLEDVRICSLPNSVGQAWAAMKPVSPGNYVAIDEYFDMPGVGKVGLYLYRDVRDNFYIIHEPV
jgi:hypothetical protein